MRISLNSLYFPNSDPKFIEAAKSVHKKFDLVVNYTEAVVRHGEWMNYIMETSNADVVGFLDIDCIPLHKNAVMDLVKFAAKNKSIAGCAQATNHIAPMTHIFIAPCCFFIYRPLWVALGKPTFAETQRSDVCEEVCYVAEEHGVRMKALYPTHFEKEPQEGVWRLHNYGLYGVGTTFAGSFYHLYQSRFQENVNMFIQRCNEVVEDKFTTDGMHQSTDFSFKGRICRFPQEQALGVSIESKL